MSLRKPTGLGRTLMIQGTSSSVGKSILVTALCRIFKQDGLRVAPFKAQNMSLNSYVTREGGEMGRAQVVQAEAAGLEPHVDMNPVLLKPEAEARSQVIVRGRVYRTMSAKDYHSFKAQLFPLVTESLDRLRAAYDIVVIEGAGSPAEVNLKASDIVNMAIARYAHSPVLLAGDIDRGGVFAALIGTMALLEPQERRLVRGLIINKFRGDPALLGDMRFLSDHTKKPLLGVVPYLRDIHIAQEDSVVLLERAEQSRQGFALPPGDNGAELPLDIAVLHLPHISNFDDFDPLESEAGVQVRYVHQAAALGTPDMIIIPGTKSTMADLQFLQQSGLVTATIELAARGVPVIGICGGFQMLGQVLRDPDQVESPITEMPGMGLLDVATTFAGQKRTGQVQARVTCGRGLFAGLEGLAIEGYEIHMGNTIPLGTAQSLFALQSSTATPARAGWANSTPGTSGSEDITADSYSSDGTVDERGIVYGTYFHGLFHNSALRRGLLRRLRTLHHPHYSTASPLLDIEDIAQADRQLHDREYDKLAAHVRVHLKMDEIYRICELTRR